MNISCGLAEIAIDLVIHWGFQVPASVCFNSAIVSAERAATLV